MPGLFSVGLVLLLLAAMAILALAAVQGAFHDTLYSWTGEEELLPQIKGTLRLLSDLKRPRLELATDVPVAHTGLCPFGVNTFLEQEVEVAKRERTLQMVREAGFCWIRQEFPWEDIEIHGKGDFQDRRWEPHRSAWEKYDNIVDLAEKYGLQIIARLDNPPAWSRADGDARGPLAPPDDFRDFGDFVEAVVSRYRGRIHYYQIWNEPNLGLEWGGRPDARQYTELLKEAYTRAKAADPDCVILAGTLAPTIWLGPENMNDFIFLQQMYDAGAAPYFDIITVQGYGLWSGPTDRTMHPRIINFGRPQYIRDIMVRNGDAHKPIWIAEMNWNAIPEGHPAPPVYGRVSEEQQARYLAQAFQRIQKEWPWVGVANVWFFKRPTDRERDQAWYYFRLVEPDFTPLPVYEAIKEYAHRPPLMYPGWHQEYHWAVQYEGDWQEEENTQAVLGRYRRGHPGDKARFTFHGRGLTLVLVGRPEAGRLRVTVDDAPPQVIDLHRPEPTFGLRVPVVQGLPAGEHAVVIEVLPQEEDEEGWAGIDGFIVGR